MEIALAFQEIERVRGTKAPSRILLLRAGDHGISNPGWDSIKITAKSAAALIERFDKQGNDVPIDYQHSTRLADKSESKGLAAGWVKELEFVNGEGLYAFVEWTDAARKEIEAKQVRYFSPSVDFDPDDPDATLVLHSVALTNRPATRDQRELLAAQLKTIGVLDMAKKKKDVNAADPVLDDVIEQVDDEAAADKVDTLNQAIAGLAEALRSAGVEVAEEYAAEDVVEAATKIVGSVPEEEATDDATEKDAAKLSATLGIEGKSLKALTASVAALQVKAAGYDDLKGKVDTLTAEKTKSRVDALIAEQVDANILNPHDEKAMASARRLAENDEEQFKDIFGSMASLPGVGTASVKTIDATDSKRNRVIADATAEWDGNLYNQGGPRDGYVALALDENDMKALTATEVAAIKE